MLKRLRRLLSSRPLSLSISIVMVLMSVVFVANVLQLRGDTASAETEVRSTIAESLAIQLSLLATYGDDESIKQSLQTYVERHEILNAASLVDANGRHIAHYGDKR